MAKKDKCKKCGTNDWSATEILIHNAELVDGIFEVMSNTTDNYTSEIRCKKCGNIEIPNRNNLEYV